MAQQLPQMASANHPMTPTSSQPVAAPRPTVPVSPLQTPVVDQPVDWASKIAEVIREQFGLRPKQQFVMYRTPYPPAYDHILFPHKYKIPDFTKFSGQEDISTVEHVNRFILQCGEAANQDPLKVRLFSLSLSGSAFAWFTTLPANSIVLG